MNEIKCPNCGTVFQIDEVDYQSIVKQIRDTEFNREVRLREEQFEKDKDNLIKLNTASVKEQYSELIKNKDVEISDLKNQIKNNDSKVADTIRLKEIEMRSESQKELSKLNEQIIDLKSKLKMKDTENELKVKDVMDKKERDIINLRNQIESDKNNYLLKEKTIKESYEEKIKDKDEQIAYYKDFKARQSTKMIGESLEQHCSVEFNRLRPLFKNAYFEKDNDVKSGSKGDFIFRDYDDDGVEVVSIMFEMKNEADETATKHKNEDFFKELDKDRRQKKCEYAVLVSLLEADNDYYNDGIVDVGHLYDKMYVIRPQFFIPIITLIRNMSYKALDYKKELEKVKNQNIDITHFEENINTFKEGFGRNYRLASERFGKAIDEIDKTIDHLNKIKEHLQKTNDNLRLANSKAEDLTIQRLTRNNPTMKEMFDELKNAS